jgi:hypothetical protein
LKIGRHARQAVAVSPVLSAAEEMFANAAKAAQRNRRQRYAFIALTLLIAIGGALAQDPERALELARCARLVKGYGATHTRTRERFLQLVTSSADAATLAREREALLIQVPAPALPREQPLRFMPRRPRPPSGDPR